MQRCRLRALTGRLRVRCSLPHSRRRPVLPLPRLQLRNQSVFEASGLALINGTYYVVFDSSESLGFLDE